MAARRLGIRLAIGAVAAWAAGAAWAQGGSSLFGGAGGPRAVTVSAEASAAEAAPGAQLAIAVVLDHALHYHTWPSADQDVLPEAIAEFAIRTSIEVGQVDPALADTLQIQWPKPNVNPVPDVTGAGATVDVPTYSGRAVAFIPVQIAEAATEGTLEVPLFVTYQACDESSCLPPESEEIVVSIQIKQGADSVTTAPLFDGFDPSVFGSDQAVAEATAGPGSRREFFGIALPSGEGALGLVITGLLAALGGFILNLTPCVLPVIPIKVMTISQHASKPAEALKLGLWMAAGVVAFWIGIGLPVAFVSSVTDPSRLFGIWWVTLGIGLIIGAMGVGIMGLFVINLPQKVYMVNPKADSAWGSFVFGVMTAVLGLPCFGFVAGALLAGAATMPATLILTIFACLGIGMALPYLVLSAKPGWVEKIPRTGPASELVKQVMGLLLLAAAAYFIGAGAIGFVSERPGMAASMPWWFKTAHWWVIALCAAAAGVWLLVRTFQITERPAPRVVIAAVALVIGGVAVAYAADTTDKARNNIWVAFDEAALEAARAQGQVVVVDFTAEWCLNCKALKAAVLTRQPVKGELLGSGVTPMVADLTSTRAPGWEKLRSLGQTGIPLLVIYGPGLDEPWQSNAYTSQQVMDALERARGARVSAR